MFKKLASTLRGWRTDTNSQSANTQSDPDVAAAEKALRLKKLSSESANVDVEAEAKKVKLQAEADAKKAEADAKKAEARRAVSEADAAAERAIAAKAESAVAAERVLAAKAESALKWADVRKRNIWFALPCVVSIALVADWWYHDSGSGIKWRMKRTLRGCPVPAGTADLQPAAVLPTPQQQPDLGVFKPLMVLGPTGCGKSTLLAKLARECSTGVGQPATPTVLIRLRLPLDEGAAVPAQRADSDANRVQHDGEATLRRLQAIAERIYEQIGFPGRHSVAFLFGQWVGSLGSETMLEVGLGTVSFKVPRATVATRERLQEALAMLYRVCEELQAERMGQGLSKLDASCVVIIDEAQDLIKDKRLAAAGGRAVFADIGTHIVGYGVDRKAVRTVVAGSSAFLAQEFAKTSPATASRWQTYTVADPTPATVRVQLKARGYTEEEADRILSVCGTRLRLLEEPLESSARPDDVEKWAHSTEGVAVRAFNSVILGLPEDHRGHFVSLLDSIAAAANGGVPLRCLDRQWTGNSDITQVVYLDEWDTYHFQSELHRRVWSTVRKEYQRFVRPGSSTTPQMR